MRDIDIRRVGSAFVTDMRFQWKQGFFIIYLIVSFFYLLILSQLPHFILDYALPVIVFSDPSVLGLFFIGGMVLLEKEQGVLQMLVVTPLTIKEYVLSKVLALTLVALMAGILITAVSAYNPVDYLTLITGIILTSVYFTLLGFIISTKAKSLNAFFLHMMPWTALLMVPCVFYVIYPNLKLLLLVPSVAGLNLVFGAVHGLPLMETIFSASYIIVVNYFLFQKSCSVFQKKMVYGGSV
jgi:fluoroquinolone transport system permease protein